jgi:hypothetical protein
VFRQLDREQTSEVDAITEDLRGGLRLRFYVGQCFT